MARFKEIKSVNPKLKQSQLAKDLGYPSSTIQRYKNDIKMLSLYRIPPDSQKRRQKISNTNLDDNSNSEHDAQRRQVTSKYLK